MKMRYDPPKRYCAYCEEEILPGDEIYSGVNEYHKDCLLQMDVEEFIYMEGDHLEIAEKEAV